MKQSFYTLCDWDGETIGMIGVNEPYSKELYEELIFQWGTFYRESKNWEDYPPVESFVDLLNSTSGPLFFGIEQNFLTIPHPHYVPGN